MRGNPRAEDIFRHTARATRWAANEANTNQACVGGAFAVRDAVRGDRVRARVRGEQSRSRRNEKIGSSASLVWLLDDCARVGVNTMREGGVFNTMHDCVRARGD